MASEVTETHLNPLQLLKTLDKILPDNAILVADGGDFVGSAAYILRYSNLNSCAIACLLAEIRIRTAMSIFR